MVFESILGGIIGGMSSALTAFALQQYKKNF